MKVLENYSLKKHNTFAVDVNAKYFAEVSSTNDIIKLLSDFKEIPKLIIGEGSDILFTKDFEGLVIQDRLKGIEVIDQTANNVLLKSSSGEIWHEFVEFCVNNNYCGVENLSLIPGTVGASPIQNIGAYGAELKDVFYSLEAIDLKTFEKKIFTARDCEFDYRWSTFKGKFKNKYFIISVTFKLSKKDCFNIDYLGIKEALGENHKNLSAKKISDAIIKIRKQKLPDVKKLGNAGSFFKNPIIPKAKFEKLKKKFPDLKFYKHGNKIKIPAAQLIDFCGWKEKRIKNTGVYKNQALVIVNYGNASGKDIYDFSKKIQASVKEKFDVEIIPEVNVF
ncbi:MAG: UDP-N-acetylmuramate dehydrogenase [Bacteroidota bacterium]|nr:UDP-N-acetylmuramate dehydrogenase [Bacteroidota bacterium]